MPYTIDQFSTGIEPAKGPDGQWYSKRFTGMWMNQTSRVPHEIDSAIKRSYFETRIISNTQPAIIGRIITQDGKNFWSVVAVVSSGIDESRSFSVHRYFWCEGKESLCLIVSWLLEQDNIPIFDPFAKSERIHLTERKIKEYVEYVEELDNWIRSQFNPLQEFYLFDEDTYSRYDESLLMIDRLATKISQDRNCLIAWAFKVEVLTREKDFLIIQAATNDAHKRFKIIFDSQPTTRKKTEELVVESELKAAIQDFESPNITDKILLNLENHLAEFKNDQKLKEILDRIFQDLQANDAAIEDKYYSKMELLTLRAILIPTTLVKDYIVYASIEKYINKKNNIFSLSIPILDKKHAINQQSLNFQYKLRNVLENHIDSYPKLKYRLREGLICAIEEFTFGNISKQALLWLLTNENSIWEVFPRTELVHILWHEVSLIKRENGKNSRLNEGESIRKLWEPLKDANHKLQKCYKNLAEILSVKQLKFKNPELDQALRNKIDVRYYCNALVFYFCKISGSKINEGIIKRLKQGGHNRVFDIDISISSDSTIEFESEIINIFGYILLFALVLYIRINDTIFGIIFGILATFFLIFYIQDDSFRKKIKQHSLPIIMLAILLSSSHVTDTLIDTPGSNPDPTNTPVQESLDNSPTSKNDSRRQNDISQNNSTSSNSWQKKAMTAFRQKNKTRDAIDKIINKLSKTKINNTTISEDDINSALQSILGFDTISYDEVKNYPNQYPDKLKLLVEKIYTYQKNQGLTPDGIINVDTSRQSTMDKLQNDIRKQISQDLNPKVRDNEP